MFVITNAAEIEAAFEGAAPRRVEDIILEIYPDATIDCQGRAHAPCDGYTVGDRAFRAGEYLPLPENEFVGGYGCEAIYDQLGEEIYFIGTRGQRKAANEVAKAQQAKFDAEVAAHVGTEGKREDFNLKVYSVFKEPGAYGVEFTINMRDENFNPVVYKGTSDLGQVGQHLKLKATVKSHWAAKGDSRKATYIAHPKVL